MGVRRRSRQTAAFQWSNEVTAQATPARKLTDDELDDQYDLDASDADESAVVAEAATDHQTTYATIHARRQSQQRWPDLKRARPMQTTGVKRDRSPVASGDDDDDDDDELSRLLLRQSSLGGDDRSDLAATTDHRRRRPAPGC